MAESFITQCPHCGTSFRVRDEQLSVANGSVRCGACLQVFSARNHVVTSAIPAQKPTVKPAAKVTPIKPEIRTSVPATPAAPKDDFNFASDDEDDAEFLFQDGEGDDDYTFDDGPEDSLFGDEEADDGFGELSDSFRSLTDSASKPKKQVDHFQRETRELAQDELTDEETPDESWAESMLEEIEKEEKISIKKPAVFEAREAGQKVKQKAKESSNNPLSHTQSAFLVEMEEPTPRPTALDFHHNGPSASQVVNSVSDEIELDFDAEERINKLRPLGWAAIGLLLVVLAAQFAWLARDKYARMDQWRGLYQQACNVFGCELPEQVDIDAIRISVSVREHKDPKMSDIRMVDVVLTNKAAFGQPFPILLLQYTDVNGKLVADQAFSPGNYLKGEMTGVELMPINTRVYISFAIQTPPKNAVNYQLILNPI